MSSNIILQIHRQFWLLSPRGLSLCHNKTLPGPLSLFQTGKLRHGGVRPSHDRTFPASGEHLLCRARAAGAEARPCSSGDSPGQSSPGQPHSAPLCRGERNVLSCQQLP